MIRRFFQVLAALTLLAVAACDKVNNTGVPNYPVDIRFYNVGVWSTYGVNGVGDWKIYDRQKGIPAGFPYNANTYTGFGGVLLIVGLDSGTAYTTKMGLRVYNVDTSERVAYRRVYSF